jgi:hypothetical protein
MTKKRINTNNTSKHRSNILSSKQCKSSPDFVVQGRYEMFFIFLLFFFRRINRRGLCKEARDNRLLWVLVFRLIVNVPIVVTCPPEFPFDNA